MNTPLNTQRLTEPDPRYAWVMVFSVFMLSTLSFGALASVSVFLKPLSMEFGWTRGQTSLGYTVISMSSAVFGIFWGIVADKFGTRWFGLVAALIMPAVLYLLSEQNSVLHFYGLYFLFGAFGNALISAPLFANVAFWFRNKPGLALGITAAGGAFGQGIMPFICGLIVETQGWQSAYQSVALIYLFIGIPIALLIRESPLRSEMNGTQLEETRTTTLPEKEVIIWISCAIIFCCLCMAVPIVHLVPLLTDAQFSLEFATSVLMVLMFCGVAGRILGGKLCDVIGALPAYLMMSLGQTVSVFWFPHLTDALALYLLAAFFGFSYSGVMSCILVCTRMMVSARFAARAMSITSFFGWTGMGLGGFVGGYFFDLNGDYFWAFAFASIMGVINLIILLAFYNRVNRHGSTSALELAKAV
jgi:MFS family permease